MRSLVYNGSHETKAALGVESGRFPLESFPEAHSSARKIDEITTAVAGEPLQDH